MLIREIGDNNLPGKVFFQTICKSFLKYFIFFFKRLDFLKKFSSLQKSKSSSHKFLNSKLSLKTQNTLRFEKVQTFFSQNC